MISPILQNCIEIAYFDRGPINDEHLILGGYWSTYWYKGKIYGTEIARGLDVLSLLPSEHLTDHEIAAASMANQGAVFNPQQQLRIAADASYGGHAYLDQLERDGALPEDSVLQLRSALDQSVNQWETGARDRRLAETLAAVQQGVDRDKRGWLGSESR